MTFVSVLKLTFQHFQLLLLRFVRLFWSKIGTDSFDFLGELQSQEQVVYENLKEKGIQGTIMATVHFTFIEALFSQ